MRDGNIWRKEQSMSAYISSLTGKQSNALLRPEWAEIVNFCPEVDGVFTIWSRYVDPNTQLQYRFLPGQFNMLYVPGLGESAISICSNSEDTGGLLGHTVHSVGNVTRGISRLRKGDAIGIRGPFGLGWPLKLGEEKDLLLMAGGTGLPSLRPVIYHILRNRERYGNVNVVYGARTPDALLYSCEYKLWEERGIHLYITVDRCDANWNGRVGVVPMAFYYLQLNPSRTIVMTCGPEAMMRFVVYESLARRIPADQIYLSLERNMKCGLGSCGHCQLGPFFVCKDGPVFAYKLLAHYFLVEEF